MWRLELRIFSKSEESKLTNVFLVSFSFQEQCIIFGNCDFTNLTEVMNLNIFQFQISCISAKDHSLKNIMYCNHVIISFSGKIFVMFKFNWYLPPVEMAISCMVFFRLSPNPGALTAATWRPILSRFTTKVVRASPSMSSATMIKGRLCCK